MAGRVNSNSKSFSECYPPGQLYFSSETEKKQGSNLVSPFRVGLSFVKEEIPSLTYILAAPRGRGRRRESLSLLNPRHSQRQGERKETLPLLSPPPPKKGGGGFERKILPLEEGEDLRRGFSNKKTASFARGKLAVDKEWSVVRRRTSHSLLQDSKTKTSCQPLHIQHSKMTPIRYM